MLDTEAYSRYISEFCASKQTNKQASKQTNSGIRSSHERCCCEHMEAWMWGKSGLPQDLPPLCVSQGDFSACPSPCPTLTYCHHPCPLARQCIPTEREKRKLWLSFAPPPIPIPVTSSCLLAFLLWCAGPLCHSLLPLCG